MSASRGCYSAEANDRRGRWFSAFALKVGVVRTIGTDDVGQAGLQPHPNAKRASVRREGWRAYELGSSTGIPGRYRHAISGHGLAELEDQRLFPGRDVLRPVRGP